MATVFVFNMPYAGHINPCMPVVRELVERGERVVFYSLERYRTWAQDVGAIFRLFPYEEKEVGRALLLMVNWQLHVIERSFPTLYEDLDQLQPSYVMSDYTCLWGRAFARHVGLPLVCLFSTFPGAFDHRPSRRVMFAEVWRSPRLLPDLVRFAWRDYRTARRLGSPRLKTPLGIVQGARGDLNVVLAGEDFHQFSPCPREDYVYVGASIGRRGTSTAPALPPFDERPLVYISLGTCFNKRPDFYRQCIEAFEDGRYQVLISSGIHGAQPQYQMLPPHIHIRQHVDQIDILSRAAVFVTHAGMNSVSESFCAGVPMIAFPQAMDQFAIARYVAASGAGFALSEHDLGARRIRERVDELLNTPGMRQSARRIGDGLRALGGPAKAAQAITGTMRALSDHPRTQRSVETMRLPGFAEARLKG